MGLFDEIAAVINKYRGGETDEPAPATVEPVSTPAPAPAAPVASVEPAPAPAVAAEPAPVDSRADALEKRLAETESALKQLEQRPAAPTADTSKVKDAIPKRLLRTAGSVELTERLRKEMSDGGPVLPDNFVWHNPNRWGSV